MRIISLYIQNHYVKNNYMPSHKLNQAKNTSHRLFKKQIIYISKCILSPPGVFFIVFVSR